MKRTLEDWQSLLEKIRTELASFNPSDWSDLRPGKLVFKFNQCNKLGCPCGIDPDQRHGPYPYLQTMESGIQRQKYLNRREAKRILPLLMERERYERLKQEEVFLAQTLGLARKTGATLPAQSTVTEGGASR